METSTITFDIGGGGGTTTTSNYSMDTGAMKGGPTTMGTYTMDIIGGGGTTTTTNYSMDTGAMRGGPTTMGTYTMDITGGGGAGTTTTTNYSLSTGAIRGGSTAMGTYTLNTGSGGGGMTTSNYTVGVGGGGGSVKTGTYTLNIGSGGGGTTTSNYTVGVGGGGGTAKPGTYSLNIGSGGGGTTTSNYTLDISGGGGSTTASNVLCCYNCALDLTGHRYIIREDKPVCIKCYDHLFANVCQICKAPIGTDHKDLSYKDKHWHEACFKCADCSVSLVDRSFACKDDKTYCADCHDNNFALRCDACNNIFRSGMKKYEFKGKQYHEQCFCCKVCRQPVGMKTFIPRDNEVVCVPCYEEQYAQRCIKCNGVINKGGVTYKNTPWHRECFTCYNCNRMLTGEKFTSRDEKPYCADCFSLIFAKKCCRCTRPVTGLGSNKFISFDDRHWHNDCFTCYRCNTSLVGRGFLINGPEVLCPDCGRA